MVLIVRAFLIVAASLTLCAAPAEPTALPRFEDYPASVQQVRKAAPARLSTSQTRRYASQLREASHHTPDFAGHYVLATWGCGASCVMAAAIDAKTGTVTFLPFTISNWPLDVTEPLAYKIDSRLLIVRGSLNEKGSGTYAYEFMRNSFRPLTSKPTSQIMPNSP